MLLSFFSTIAQQQKQTFTARVLAGGEAVPSATARINNQVIHSNDNGIFTFTGISGTTIKIEISAVGLKPLKNQVKLPTANKDVLVFNLEQEDKEIEEVNVLGRTESQDVNRQAYNVVAIDAKALHNTTLDLSHALDRVSGVRVRETGGVGSAFNFSLNGFTGNQVKFFIDGIPMDNFGSSFQINNIPINLAERLEVYKGVVPVWLGSDALGGAVNIVTGNGKPNYLDVSYSYGSFNTHRTTINSAFTTPSGWTFQLNAYQNYSDNNYWVNAAVSDLETRQYYADARVRRFHDTYRNETVIGQFGVVGKSFADALLIGINLGQNRADIQTGATMETVFGDWFRRGSIVMPTLKYRKKDIVKGLDVYVNANYNLGYEQNIDTVARLYNWLGQHIDRTAPAGERSYSMYKFRNNMGVGAAGVNYRINEQNTLSLNNTVSTFNRQGSDELAPFNEAYEQPRKSIKNVLGLSYQYSRDRWNATVFAKDLRQNVRFAEAFTPGGDASQPLQYRQMDTKFSAFGYGLAGTYFIQPSLQAKVSFERSYRLPDPYELFGDLINTQGNVALKPESSNNINLGLSYVKTIAKMHHVHGDVNFLLREAKDFIRPDLNPNGTQQVMRNLLDVSNRGVDFSLRYGYHNNFTIGLSGTYQNLRNEVEFEPGSSRVSPVYKDRIPNIPYFYGNGDASYFIHDLAGSGNHLTITYNLLYVHEFYLAWPSQGGLKNQIPEQFAHDLSATYSLKDGRYNIGLACRNLFDNRLYDNFMLQKPSRAFSVKLRYFINK
ncbi:TonB-dependent receptor plug [Sphingobacterium deserti]|uniref:TonB-dependent receptor plug n=2 Tax=Sphingobacterium deserti TaxID=1229276 RepID=A0A0B8TB08_9SPHI|nr:TonB-dependent receptor plug [Sphingobacterium deserti]